MSEVARLSSAGERRRALLFLLGCGLVLALVGVASNIESFEIGGPATGIVETTASSLTDDDTGLQLPATTRGSDAELSRPRLEIPGWLLVGLAVAAAGAAIWFLSRQQIKVSWARFARGGRPSDPVLSLTEDEKNEAIADFADDLIAEFKLDGEPREAIQHAYAAVESGFGVRDFKRKPAEPPLKYLTRIFGRRAQAAEPLRRLTTHFQLARFSSETVTEQMRSDAVEALREIRDSYRSGSRAKAGAI